MTLWILWIFLISRLGLIKSQANIDGSLEEAVISLIWVSPRLEVEVEEMKVIGEQLRSKYGVDFYKSAIGDKMEKVNKVLIRKMGVQAPAKGLVELYIVEISKSYNVPFTPDPAVIEALRPPPFNPNSKN